MFSRFLKTTSGNAVRAQPAISVHDVEHGCLGPEGPGVRFRLEVPWQGPPSETCTFLGRVSQRGQRIAGWRAGYADHDGYLVVGSGASLQNGHACGWVWLPYAALPSMVEGKVDFDFSLYDARLFERAKGAVTLAFEPHEERLRSSALGALVEFLMHTARLLGPHRRKDAAHIREALASQFQLDAQGEDVLADMLERAASDAWPQWKMLWNLERWFQKEHHAFLLTRAFELIAAQGRPVTKAVGYLEEWARLLQMDNNLVQITAQEVERAGYLSILGLGAEASSTNGTKAKAGGRRKKATPVQALPLFAGIDNGRM